MRYLALVTDYDGTVASDDRVPAETVRALERLRISGRRAILVTGRRLDDLLAVCPCARLFDSVVAENGAVVYDPTSRDEVCLANPPPKLLLRSLEAEDVGPLEIGQVLVATHADNRAAVQNAIWTSGLELQVIGNRSALMVLPAGINKATGLQYALGRLGLSRHEVVGVGDAENDHSFLSICECSVAVANAVPSLKEEARFVTRAENGAGVAELIDDLIRSDLDRLQGDIEQNLILLGHEPDGAPVEFAPYGHNTLVAGPSGSGKSTVAAGIVERLIAKDYQVCIVDPEGDYGTLRDVVALGNQWRAPGVSEIISILEDPRVNLSINLLGIPLGDRPAFFAQLISHLQAMRARSGRPHWLVLDEAHHLIPDDWGLAGTTLPHRLGETLLVTVHPEHVASTVLLPVDLVVAIGTAPQDTLARFAAASGRSLPWTKGLTHRKDHAVVWDIASTRAPFPIVPAAARVERIRHRRKYAEGDLRWHSFYFRGPQGRQNIKAQNLAIFTQIAQGIDEDTWMYHLRRGDYSRWLRHAVRDTLLADEAERVESRSDLTPGQSRQMILELITARYTLPA